MCVCIRTVFTIECQQPHLNRFGYCIINNYFFLLFFFSLAAVMIATEEEMVSAKLPIEERDYCAHTKIDYLRCIADVWPFPYKCAHEKHAQALCQYDE